MIDLAPDEQTLLTVVLGAVFGIPAARAAWRAGACPKLAEHTLPIKTSSIFFGSTFPFSNAPLIAAAPNSIAETLAKIPPKLPKGVRTAETI